MKDKSLMKSIGWFSSWLNQRRIKKNQTLWYAHGSEELMKEFFVRKPWSLGLLMLSWHEGGPSNTPVFIDYEDIVWKDGKLKSITTDNTWYGEVNSDGRAHIDFENYSGEFKGIPYHFMFSVVCENQFYSPYPDKRRNELRWNK